MKDTTQSIKSTWYIPQPGLKVAEHALKENTIAWTNLPTSPTIEYYRAVYKQAGYSAKVIERIIDGLSKSSQYDGKTS